MCFGLAGGAIRPRLRKCLHLYLYVIDRELGVIHIRLQTWFPFQIQVYLNGHEWLARQLERRGVGFERYENTFLSIEDLPPAQRLCAGFARRRWRRLFDAFALGQSLAERDPREGFRLLLLVHRCLRGLDRPHVARSTPSAPGP